MTLPTNQTTTLTEITTSHISVLNQIFMLSNRARFCFTGLNQNAVEVSLHLHLVLVFNLCSLQEV